MRVTGTYSLICINLHQGNRVLNIYNNEFVYYNLTDIVKTYRGEITYNKFIQQARKYNMEFVKWQINIWE